MAEFNIVSVDSGNKLVLSVWRGKPDYTGLEEGCNATDSEIIRYKRGEPLLLIDSRNTAIRFLSPDSGKLLRERTLFCLSYCRKMAYVVKDIILEKQLEMTATGYAMGNFRIFGSEREAMKWLTDAVGEYR